MIDWKQFVSIVALLLSIITFGFTYRLSNESAVTSVRPVLIFEYTASDGWVVRNVGSGPALNVVVAMKTEASDWFDPVRVPPLSKDGYFKLTWIGHSNIRTLGAYYSDILDRRYSSICTDDLSTTHAGNQIGEWREADISRHWNRPQQSLQ